MTPVDELTGRATGRSEPCLRANGENMSEHVSRAASPPIRSPLASYRSGLRLVGGDPLDLEVIASAAKLVGRFGAAVVAVVAVSSTKY